jgi:hypothetical protein
MSKTFFRKKNPVLTLLIEPTSQTSEKFKIIERGTEELLPYRPGIPTCNLQVKIRSGACTQAPPRALQHRIQPPSQGGLRGCHVSSGLGSRLPDRKGSNAATCIMAPNPASQ